MSSDQGKLSCMKVEIQCKKWIKPATPTPVHLQKYKLSSIDQLQSSMFVQPIFYFHISTESEVQTTPEKLLHLEESLSKVLTLYYPFAGRLIDDDSLISCQDQGVPFVVAKVDRKLDELADEECDTKVLSALESLQTYSNLLVMVQVSIEIDHYSDIKIQVNIFKCGGLAISLGFSHKVGDMFTISSFMDAWATTCRLGTLDQVIRPSFSFSSLLPPSDYHFPKLPNKSGSPPKYIMKRYIFTGEAIAKIRSSIISKSESYTTRVELVMAVITRSLTNIEQPKSKPLVIVQPMNFRSRTGLPIQDNSCGNLLSCVIATCGQLDDNNGLSWELPELADFIKSSVKNVAAEMSKVRDWSELSNMVVKAYLKFHQEIYKGGSVNLVIISSWCRFPLYKLDFGWGSPTLVGIVTVPHRYITLIDCKSDTDGIEALLCLKEEDMARFQQEQDILEYASF